MAAQRLPAALCTTGAMPHTAGTRTPHRELWLRQHPERKSCVRSTVDEFGGWLRLAGTVSDTWRVFAAVHRPTGSRNRPRLLRRGRPPADEFSRTIL